MINCTHHIVMPSDARKLRGVQASRSRYGVGAVALANAGEPMR